METLVTTLIAFVAIFIVYLSSMVTYHTEILGPVLALLHSPELLHIKDNDKALFPNAKSGNGPLIFMKKKKAKTHREYVNHPRYGNHPIHSGYSACSDEILRGHWSYHKDSVFVESAIKADTSKQNYSLYPRTIYVDIEKKCIQCKRWFIFYAEEQRYWFETLGFYVDADCVKCVDCRKNEQSIKHMMLDYETLIKKEKRTEIETSDLKYIALELYQLGYIRDKNKVDKIG